MQPQNIRPLASQERCHQSLPCARMPASRPCVSFKALISLSSKTKKKFPISGTSISKQERKPQSPEAAPLERGESPFYPPASAEKKLRRQEEHPPSQPAGAVFVDKKAPSPCTLTPKARLPALGLPLSQVSIQEPCGEGYREASLLPLSSSPGNRLCSQITGREREGEREKERHTERGDKGRKRDKGNREKEGERETEGRERKRET
ncbi:hypothetical protein E2320_002331, partial [Naja naja]